MDDYVGRLRGLIIALEGIVSAAACDEVEHLIDHGEGGEAMRALAWIIVETICASRAGRSKRRLNSERPRAPGGLATRPVVSRRRFVLSAELPIARTGEPDAEVLGGH